MYTLFFSWFLVPTIISTCATIVLAYPFIIFAKQYFVNQTPRAKTTSTAHCKLQTPTMGGVLLAIIFIVEAGLYGLHTSAIGCIIILLAISFFLLGAVDDVLKIYRKSGISTEIKFIFQTLFAFLIAWYSNTHLFIHLSIPLFSHVLIISILWTTGIIVSWSNAINITDGLDGLATVALIPNFFLCGFLAYKKMILTSNCMYLTICTFCAIIVGILCGFLWHNRYPARLFMGDSGSLPLGALLGFFSLLLGHEWLFVFTGSVFVLEVSTCLLQICSVRWRKKRIFKMAPIHHHFELAGWHETTITAIVGAVTSVCTLIALLFMVD